MYILIVFLLISFISEVFGECCVDIKSTGIHPMKPGDVGMVFFITLGNTCNQKFHINVKMIQCSEIIGDSEEDTSSMYLIGGYMGVLERESTLTTTLIYPNMYLYNRQGHCVIGIHYTDEYHGSHQLRTRIKFCTTLRDGAASPEVKAFLIKPMDNCDSPDLDPLDKCVHVDCMMKYLGVRNYYNEKWKRCQKVPVCVSDCSRDDPDVSYIPTSNRCRNLASCISESDISLLEEGVVSNNTAKIFSSRGLLLRCNNGRINNETGVCKCDKGYTSMEPDIENYVPGLTIYHMCNIRINSWKEANLSNVRSTVLEFSTLSLAITMVILLVTFGCYGIYVYLKSYDPMSPFDQSSTESIEEIDSDCSCNY